MARNQEGIGPVLQCTKRLRHSSRPEQDTAGPGVQREPNTSRILSERNVETPSGSGPRSGKPEATKAQLPGGNRMVREANADRAKAQGKQQESSSLPYNPSDTDACPARKGADADQVDL